MIFGLGRHLEFCYHLKVELKSGPVVKPACCFMCLEISDVRGVQVGMELLAWQLGIA